MASSSRCQLDTSAFLAYHTYAENDQMEIESYTNRMFRSNSYPPMFRRADYADQNLNWSALLTAGNQGLPRNTNWDASLRNYNTLPRLIRSGVVDLNTQRSVSTSDIVITNSQHPVHAAGSSWSSCSSGSSTSTVETDQSGEVRASTAKQASSWHLCMVCGKEFKNAQGLGGHMSVHRRERAQYANPMALPRSSPSASIITLEGSEVESIRVSRENSLQESFGQDGLVQEAGLAVSSEKRQAFPMGDFEAEGSSHRSNHGYKGVRYRAQQGKYVAEIRPPRGNKTFWLGTYSTPEEAARAIDVGIIYFGNDTPLNFPDSPLYRNLPVIPPGLPRGDLAAALRHVAKSVESEEARTGALAMQMVRRGSTSTAMTEMVDHLLSDSHLPENVVEGSVSHMDSPGPHWDQHMTTVPEFSYKSSDSMFPFDNAGNAPMDSEALVHIDFDSIDFEEFRSIIEKFERSNRVD